MKKGRHYSEEEVKLIAQSAIGKTFKEIIDSELITIENNKIQKGSLGDIIEEALFGIEKNTESEPDFIDAGIELKVTPYKRNKDNTLSAKERLVLNIIDYDTEYANQFKSSHFWFKNNKIEIIWYLNDETKDKLDFIITNELLFDLAISKDLKQIEKDYYFIVDKIKQGKAHELSEADTMYLGACTKGTDSNDLRKQPFSDIPAMRRAFCFKTSYMTQLVRKYIGDYSHVEQLITNHEDFNEYVNNKIKPFIGMYQNDLIKMFNIESNAKNLNSIIINKMFGISGNLRDTEEFLKANIIPRTLRVESNGRIIESMPFPCFEYKEIVKERWDNCELKEILETTKFMFFIFKHDGTDYVFKGIKLWNMPEEILEKNVKEVWIRTKHVVQTGNIVKEVLPNKRLTNFPGMIDDEVCHVRPHARDASDTYELPTPDLLTGLTDYTKHCFWINNKYLESIIEEQ